MATPIELLPSPVPPTTTLSIWKKLPFIPSWVTHHTKPLLYHSKWCQLEQHTIIIPHTVNDDNLNKHNEHAATITRTTVNESSNTLLHPESNTISDWCWIVTPNYINVAICTVDHEWIVFYQNKYAVNYQLKSNTLAPVGGYIDNNELPLHAAQRECLEECGYTSTQWYTLHECVSDANRGGGIGYLFVCFDAVYSGTTQSDDLEQQHQLSLTTDELEICLLNGEFKCQAWIACMSLALLQYKRRYK